MTRDEFDKLQREEQEKIINALLATTGVLIFPDGLPELLAESRERVAWAAFEDDGDNDCCGNCKRFVSTNDGLGYCSLNGLYEDENNYCVNWERKE